MDKFQGFVISDKFDMVTGHCKFPEQVETAAFPNQQSKKYEYKWNMEYAGWGQSYRTWIEITRTIIISTTWNDLSD